MRTPVLMRTAAFVTAAIVGCIAAASADMWLVPYERSYESANGKFRFTVLPTDRATLGVLSRHDDDGRTRTVWWVPLSRVPQTALVADDGQHVVTLGIAGNAEPSEPVIRVFDGLGDSVRAMAPEQFVPTLILTRYAWWDHRGRLNPQSQELELTVWTREPSVPGQRPGPVDSALVRIRLADGQVVDTHVY